MDDALVDALAAPETTPRPNSNRRVGAAAAQRAAAAASGTAGKGTFNGRQRKKRKAADVDDFDAALTKRARQLFGLGTGGAGKSAVSSKWLEE